MLLSRIFVQPPGEGAVYEQMVQAALAAIASKFPELRTEVSRANHFVQIWGIGESELRLILDSLEAQDLEYTIAIEEEYSDSELAAARFLPLLVRGDYLDTDTDGNPL